MEKEEVQAKIDEFGEYEHLDMWIFEDILAIAYATSPNDIDKIVCKYEKIEKIEVNPEQIMILLNDGSKIFSKPDGISAYLE